MISDPLRVTHVVTQNKFFGTESHVATLSRELARLGVVARIVCGGAIADLMRGAAGDAVRVCPLALNGRDLPRDWRAAHRAIAGWNPTIVHAHLGSSMLCAALLNRRRTPFIYTQHFTRSDYRHARGPRGLARALAHRLIHARIDRAITTTEAARQEMIAHEGFSPATTSVIPLGIDAEAVEARARADGPPIRAELGLPPTARLLVTPARLEPEKDHVTLLEAFASVAGRCPNVHLLCAGTGPLAAEVADRARRLGLDRRAHFLGFRRDVPRLLAEATLCVLPSYDEPFGLTLLEAMAVGTPVIACEAVGPREIVAHGETGLLAPARDAAGLAAAMLALLEDPARGEAMALAGRRRVLTCFTARRMAERTLAVYQEANRASLAPATMEGQDTRAGA